MSSRTYYKTTTVIFALIGILHLVRIRQGWEAVIGGVSISMGVSVVAAIVAGYLAYRGYALSKHS
ncbi:hypothetical protein EPN83_01340 [Patescibacteria group bacterium]|nr:MAG: hypothetical protein EPN83_01340 [Patescibacteria group bacterium]